MLRKVLEIPWYLDANAYSKKSNSDNDVLTDSISSKLQGDYRYFRGSAATLRVVLRRAAQCSHTELRCAPQSYAELHSAA
jgi:hypothetical protein